MSQYAIYCQIDILGSISDLHILRGPLPRPSGVDLRPDMFQDIYFPRWARDSVRSKTSDHVDLFNNDFLTVRVEFHTLVQLGVRHPSTDELDVGAPVVYVEYGRVIYCSFMGLRLFLISGVVLRISYFVGWWVSAGIPARRNRPSLRLGPPLRS